MSQPGIVTVGSINIDLVAYASRRPKIGETFPGEKFQIGMGGKGANQAVQAALSGAASYIIARVGKDVFAGFAYNAFDQAGVNREYIIEDEIGTGIGQVVVEANGDYSAVIIARANGNLCPADVDYGLPAFKAAHILLLQLEVPIPTVVYAARVARQSGLQVFLNAAPSAVLPQELLENVDVLIVNEIEAEVLSGMAMNGPEGMDGVLNKLRQRCGNVVITLGAQGLVALDSQNNKFSIAGHPVSVANTVGAGDAFIGELAARMAEGASLFNALPYANAAGAVAVMQATSQAAKSNRELIKELVSRNNTQIL